MDVTAQVSEAASVLPTHELSDAFADGPIVEELEVSLSNEIVHLLSEQLYTSPLKAIEEIVVNAYDADASQCRIGLLLGDSGSEETVLENDQGDADDDAVAPMSVAADTDVEPRGIIAVFDDGDGMNLEELGGLWRVGDSPKRSVSGLTPKFGRKIVGKFGIGKLATYAVAKRITYVTSSAEGVHHVVCDFRLFSPSAGKTPPVTLIVRSVQHLPALLARPDMVAVLDRLGLAAENLTDGSMPTWTLCLLDELKTKATDLKVGRLAWVLRTAMPLRSGFRVFLNGVEHKSSKENQTKIVEFKTGELSPDRIAALNKKLGIQLTSNGEMLVEPKLFPSGIRGDAIVTDGTLVGKSDNLMGRSHGFFVRVRDRVVNLEDPLFHNTPISHGTFNRFRADLEIDDLHEDITAPREGVGVGRRRDVASTIAREIGLQARDAYEDWKRKKSDQKLTPEDTRIYVAEHLVERPVADALAIYGTRGTGGDVDRGWLYMDDVAPTDLSSVVEQLYQKRTRYNFQSVALTRAARLAKFNPAESMFTVNDDHQLIQAFKDDARAKELLDLVVVAEVMLEVYMVESGVDRFLIGEVLHRRDTLLRSLAEDRVYSREAIINMLRLSSDNAIELELALIAAARALGFQTKHIGGSGEPDGIASFLDSEMNELIITLEAKASQGIPSLGHLDFAGLQEHKENARAVGCLLVAPSYPAGTDPTSAVSSRGNRQEISCWTIEQLVSVVEAVERREITTRQVAEIVMSCFSPADVGNAITRLLSSGTDMDALYRGVMDVLQRMFRARLQPGDTRKVSGVTSILSVSGEFPEITENEVRKALVDLAHQSRGGMAIRDDVIVFFTDFEEVTRRVSSLTGQLGNPRSLGTFKN